MKRLLALVLTIFMVVGTTGCSKKDFAAITLSPCVLEFGETKTLQPFLPDTTIEDPVSVTLTPLGAESSAAATDESSAESAPATDASSAAESAPATDASSAAESAPAAATDGLTAVFTDGELTADSSLTLTGNTPGNYTLTFTQSAKGYNDAIITMEVTVNEPPPPPLEAALYSVLLGLNTSIPAKDGSPTFRMEQGLNADLSVMSKLQGFTVTAESSDPCLTVTVTGADMQLVPVAAGNATVTITVAHPDYSPASIELVIEVKPPHTTLVLADGTKTPISVSQGQSATIPFVYDGELSFSVSGDNIAVNLTEGKAVLMGIREGGATVTATAKKEGFTDTELAVAVTVTAPAATPAPAAATDAAPSGEYASLIKEIHQAVNDRRAAAGVSPLVLNTYINKAAAVRAAETAENESHTRPDGRRGLTVFDDYKLTRYNLLGENLAGSSAAESGAEVVARWMDSPAHRDALLDGRFSETGIGVHYDGEMYRYCQLFGGIVTE